MIGYINLTHTNNGKIEQVRQELIDYINAHSAGEYKIVETLPTASAETYFNTSKIIYMVRNTSTSGDNYYDEYITIRSGEEGSYTYSWEHIGSTQIDLSNYVQKTQTIAGVDLQDNITTGELQVALEDSTHRFVSDAEKANWDDKQAELVSGENIKTINNESVLGGGNIQVGYPVIEGSAAPTSATVGKVNQLYRNTTDNQIYICSAVVAQGTEPETYEYVWAVVGSRPKYMHHIGLYQQPAGNVTRVYFNIVTSSNVPYTIETITDLMREIYNQGFRDANTALIASNAPVGWDFSSQGSTTGFTHGIITAVYITEYESPSFRGVYIRVKPSTSSVSIDDESKSFVTAVNIVNGTTASDLLNISTVYDEVVEL